MEEARQYEAEAWRRRGNESYGEGKWGEARILYDQSISIKDTAAARANRAAATLKLGDDIEGALQVRRRREEDEGLTG